MDSFILRLLTSEQVKVVGIEQLEAKQGKNNFKRERSSIYKVSVKQLNSVVKTYEAHLKINQILVKIYIRENLVKCSCLLCFEIKKKVDQH